MSNFWPAGEGFPPFPSRENPAAPDAAPAAADSFRSKMKITGKTPAVGNTKDVEIAVSLKYSSNFWRNLEISIINCEINLFLTWSADCVISFATRATKFATSNTIIKLLQQWKSGFKRTINWNKYRSKASIERQNQYFDNLTDPTFQGANRLFVLSFENNADTTAHIGYFLPKVETKDYIVKINGQNLFDQPVKNDLGTSDNIQKIASG